jgi:hypothetical protein
MTRRIPEIRLYKFFIISVLAIVASIITISLTSGNPLVPQERTKATTDDYTQQEIKRFRSDNSVYASLNPTILRYQGFDDPVNFQFGVTRGTYRLTGLTVISNVQKSPTSDTNKVLYVPGGSTSASSITIPFPSAVSDIGVYFAVYDDMSASKGMLTTVEGASGSMSIGVDTNVFPKTYALRINDDYIDSGFPRQKGWHNMAVIVTPGGSFTRIDGLNLYSPTYVTSPGNGVNYFYVAAIAGKQTNFTLLKNMSLTSVSSVHLSNQPNTATAAYLDKILIFQAPSDRSGLIQDTIQKYVSIYSGVQLSDDIPWKNTYFDTNSYITKLRYLFNKYYLSILLNNSTERQTNLMGIDASLTYFDSFIGSKSSADYNSIVTDWRVPILPEMLLVVAHTIQKYDPDKFASVIMKPNIIRFTKDVYEYLLTTNPETGFKDDSSAETNAWNASSLAWGANFGSLLHLSDVTLSGLITAAPCWSRATIIPANLTKTLTCVPMKPPVLIQTVRSDYTMDNHGYTPNTMYQGSTLHSLARGALSYTLVGKPVPREFTPAATIETGNYHQWNFWGRYTKASDPLIDLTFFTPRYNIERNSGGLQWLAPLLSRQYGFLPFPDGKTLSEKENDILIISYLSNFLQVVMPPATYVKATNVDLDIYTDPNNQVNSTNSYWKFVMDTNVVYNWILGIYK